MKSDRHEIFYQIICNAFCIIITTSNIISAKMVTLPLFSDFTIPAGLLTYPLTIFLTDFVTEIYGAKKAKLMVYIALGMNLLCYGIIEFSLMLPAAKGDSTESYKVILGMSGLRIFSSLIAYILSQIVAIEVYQYIKSRVNLPFLWLRSNGSNCVAQLTDTIAIDLIYLFWGLGMPIGQAGSIMLFSYFYKILFGAMLTPIFCLAIAFFRENSKRSIYTEVY